MVGIVNPSEQPCRLSLRRDVSGSALPTIPQIRFMRGNISGLPRFTHLLRPASLLALLYGSDRSPSRRGLLHPGFQRDRPVVGYDYSSGWTPLLVGLSPTGMAARLAARHLRFPGDPSCAFAPVRDPGRA